MFIHINRTLTVQRPKIRLRMHIAYLKSADCNKSNKSVYTNVNFYFVVYDLLIKQSTKKKQEVNYVKMCHFLGLIT